MRVGVGDAVEDGVVLEEQIEAADVLADGEREQQKSGGDGDAAPGQWSGTAEDGRSSARPPPAASRNSAARMQTSTASVSSHPAMSCHAGSVKR